MNIFLSFLPASVFIALLLYNGLKVRRWLCLSNYIIAIYTLSVLAFGINCLINDQYYFNVEALIWVFLPILVLTRPLAGLERKLGADCELSPFSHGKALFVMYFLVFLGLVSIVFSVPYIGNLAHVDLSTFRYELVVYGGLYERSIYSRIAIFGAYLFPIAIFFFFYSSIFHEEKRMLRSLLFITSLSFVLYTLTAAGRDGIVFWLMTFVGMYCFFYPLLPSKAKKRTLWGMLLVPVLVGPVIYVISVKRFSYSDSLDMDVWVSLLDYIGMPLYELSKRIDLLGHVDYAGDSRILFPLFTSVFELIRGEELSELNRFVLRENSLSLGLETHRFSFFVGSLFTELRHGGTILMSLIMYGVYSFAMKSKEGLVSAGRVLIGLSWYLIPITGVFYFYYSQRVGNLFLLIPFFIYAFSKMRLKQP